MSSRWTPSTQQILLRLVEPSSAAVEIWGRAAHQMLPRLGTAEAPALLDAEQSGFVVRCYGSRAACAVGIPARGMRVVPVEEQQRYGVVVGVTEQPAPVSGVVVGVVTAQPAPASGVVVGVLTEQPGASSGGAARGSLEFLGRWNEKRSDRAMPTKLKAERDTETMVRVGFGKLVDELVQNGASSGILAISCWSEMRTSDKRTY